MLSRFRYRPMALTLAPRGVAACKPWELEPNKTQAPDGDAVTDLERCISEKSGAGRCS